MLDGPFRPSNHRSVGWPRSQSPQCQHAAQGHTGLLDRDIQGRLVRSRVQNSRSVKANTVPWLWISLSLRFKAFIIEPHGCEVKTTTTWTRLILGPLVEQHTLDTLRMLLGKDRTSGGNPLQRLWINVSVMKRSCKNGGDTQAQAQAPVQQVRTVTMRKATGERHKAQSSESHT